MIDLHMHTIWSDGVLIPAELVRRAYYNGCKGMAITDHADFSNMALLIERIAEFCLKTGKHLPIPVIPGIELTHMPRSTIPDAINEARELGAKIIVIHGETVTEPVPEGTNNAAIKAKCDILAHPGLITLADAKLAAKNGVYLEITARKGHAFTNGHVLAMARKAGAKLVINSDAHAPGDLLTEKFREAVALGAGMTRAEITAAGENSRRLLDDGRK